LLREKKGRRERGERGGKGGREQKGGREMMQAENIENSLTKCVSLYY